MDKLSVILPTDGIRASVIAKRLGVSSDQVVDLIREKKLKGVKIVDGGKRSVWVSTDDWIVAYLKRINPELRNV